MAKKKAKAELKIRTTGTKEIELPQAVIDLAVRIDQLEQRIDRIVAAIDKSRKVRGL